MPRGTPSIHLHKSDPKVSHKGQILYDSTYRKHLEQSNSERQKQWLPEAEGVDEKDGKFHFSHYILLYCLNFL